MSDRLEDGDAQTSPLRRSRRLLAFGAVLIVGGLAIASATPVAGMGNLARGESQRLLGGAIVLAGWVAFTWGIHRFGRSSDD